MKTTLSPIQQERLDDLKSLSNHGGRDQWHGLRCHHISNGQFTATYSDIAARWGVKPSAVYSTIKRFIKLGLIAVERFERATLFTIIEVEESHDDDYIKSAPQAEDVRHAGRSLFKIKKVVVPQRRSQRFGYFNRSGNIGQRGVASGPGRYVRPRSSLHRRR